MKIQRLSSLLLALLISTCITPLAASSNGNKFQASPSAPPIGTTVPSSPQASTIAYIPLVMMSIRTTPPINTPTPTQTPSATATPIPPVGDGMIADHTVIASFTNIPEAYLNAAAGLKTLFMHQSTGNNIYALGLQCLSEVNSDPNYYPPECTQWASGAPYDPYDDRNWDWKLWDSPTADAIAKTDQWVSVVNAQQQNYQVLGMKFCYIDGWNQDFTYYRDHMLALESAYPSKIFIWSTSALWNNPGGACQDTGFNSCKNIYEFNQQVREFAKANHRPLYDIADIESHDTSGNLCFSNGYEGLCNEYYDGFAGGGGGHPDETGSLRLAQGFWWLMARISGWDGH